MTNHITQMAAATAILSAPVHPSVKVMDLDTGVIDVPMKADGTLTLADVFAATGTALGSKSLSVNGRMLTNADEAIEPGATVVMTNRASHG